MALGYLEGSCAGVTLQSSSGDKLKVSLIGRGNLTGARAVNIRRAASGRQYTQSFELPTGVPFGLRFEWLPTDVFEALVAAILAATDGETTFAVDVTDDIGEYSFDAVIAGPDWLKMPDDARTLPDIIKGPIEMNFLTA